MALPEARLFVGADQQKAQDFFGQPEIALQFPKALRGKLRAN
jgi:hypothetical protein